MHFLCQSDPDVRTEAAIRPLFSSTTKRMLCQGRSPRKQCCLLHGGSPGHGEGAMGRPELPGAQQEGVRHPEEPLEENYVRCVLAELGGELAVREALR